MFPDKFDKLSISNSSESIGKAGDWVGGQAMANSNKETHMDIWQTINLMT